MIHIFPLIASNSINPNTLPAVAKVLEHYILIHKLDSVTTHGRIISSANGFTKMARKTFGLENVRPSGSEIGNKPGIKKLNVDKPDFKELNKKYEDGDKGYKGKDNSSPFNVKGISTKTEIEKNSLAVQPTWVTLDTGSGVKLVGVKVVPYTVDDKQIIDLLMYDKNLTGFSHFVTAAERKIASMAYSIWGSTFGKVLDTLSFGSMGSNIISGDPKDDVILGNTDFKKNVFVMLNSMSIPEDFTNDMGTTKKLFNLGWASLIVNDDVNKKVTFCMKEFHGICHSVSHQFLHAGLSKEIKTAYDDLNDVKSASNPIFAKMTKPSNLDSMFHEKLVYHDTLRLMMEQENINLVDVIKAAKSKDYEKIDKTLGGDGVISNKTYEKVQWHNNNPEMKTTITYFLEELMTYLNNNVMLNSYGRELFELNGIDEHSTLTSDMLTDKGNEFVSNNYTKLLHKFVDEKEFDVSHADSLLKSMHNSSDNTINAPDTRMENAYKLLSTDRTKFSRSLTVSKKILTNSVPTLPSTVTDSLANLIALRASQKGDEYIDQTKADLKETVDKLRDTLEKDEDNKKFGGFQKESIVAIIFIFLALVAGITIVQKKEWFEKIFSSNLKKINTSLRYTRMQMHKTGGAKENITSYAKKLGSIFSSGKK